MSIGAVTSPVFASVGDKPTDEEIAKSNSAKVKFGIGGGVIGVSGALFAKRNFRPPGDIAPSVPKGIVGGVVAGAGALMAIDAIRAAEGEELVSQKVVRGVQSLIGWILPESDTVLMGVEGVGYLAAGLGAYLTFASHRAGAPRQRLAVPAALLAGGLGLAHLSRTHRGNDGPIKEAKKGIDGVVNKVLPPNSTRRDAAGHLLRIGGFVGAVGAWVALNPHRANVGFAKRAAEMVTKNPADAGQIIKLQRAAATAGGLYAIRVGNGLFDDSGFVDGVVHENTHNGNTVSGVGDSVREVRDTVRESRAHDAADGDGAVDSDDVDTGSDDG